MTGIAFPKTDPALEAPEVSDIYFPGPDLPARVRVPRHGSGLSEKQRSNMKIGIQTWGSQGDIRPFLALADGLLSAGHEVTLAITSVDSALDDTSASRAGVKIRAVSSPVIQDKAELNSIEGKIFGEPDPVKQTQTIIEALFLPAEAAMYQVAEQLCAENDLVIGHFFHYPLNAAAERAGRPYVSVALVHSAIPSAYQPPAGIPNLGRLGNRLTWSMVKSVLNKKLKTYSDDLRIRHGMTPARDLIANVWASERLTLVAVSPQICRRNRDWPAHYQVCGFLNRQDAPSGSGASEALGAFLSQGDPPVYMTFGSVMSGGDQTEMITLLREAAEKAAVRAIIQAPGVPGPRFNSTDTVHYAHSAPHAEIFPRCRAVVHHGGAGTTQSALLAGKPSVVIAHTSEQAFWGRELARIGVTSKPLSRRGLTVEQLATHIKLVAESSAINEKAKQIGVEMAKENGVATAVALINDKFSA